MNSSQRTSIAHHLMTRITVWLAMVAVLVITLPAVASKTSAAPLTVSVTYEDSITDSFTGRVYLMVSKGDREPRKSMSWFNPHPMYAQDVENWTPGERLVFDDDAVSYPKRLSELDSASWSIQAIMRLNQASPKVGTGAGNAYSPVIERQINGADGGNHQLTINQTVDKRPFRETDDIKLFECRSEILSKFHGRDVMMRAAVILPKNYDPQGDRKYPAYYWINGFGGDHHFAHFFKRRWGRTPYSDRIIRVIPNPLCYSGHHVFADSANNGPRGTAFVEEFIPKLEEEYPIVADSSARFLGGHSSGGWSSLWLQIQHPDFFGGTWSTAPDPVDFRAFQTVNIYAEDANMYRDENGSRRPLARMNDKVAIWCRDFAQMEEVIGDGGQLRSFEWVFSPKGPNGRPKPLFDRDTGEINPKIAHAWKKYDIRRVLDNNWDMLGPKLNGKLHIFAGGRDSFFLEDAVQLLRESLNNRDADIVIKIFPDADHGSFLTSELLERIDREMWNAFREHHPKHAKTFKPVNE